MAVRPIGIPVFSSIFAQDTIASSAYNSLQVSLEKRFSQGLQFSAAYTWSKSIDEASSFEGILNPLPGAITMRGRCSTRATALSSVITGSCQ